MAERLGGYIFATIVQLPFHILLASPFLVAAAVAAFFTRRRIPFLARLALISGIVALGLAPVYGAHRSMIPVYTLVISGDASIVSTAASFICTWGLALLVGYLVAKS